MKALIITRSLVLQQGLSALLESLPGILSVKTIKDLSNAYTWIESHPPDIVLLDMDFPERDIRMVLKKLRTLAPEMQRVLLVDHVEEIRWVPRYAEAILIKGEAPSAVAASVTNLLFPKGDAREYRDSNL